MPKPSISPADAALARVRELCLRFPGAEEKLSHGAPSFHVRGKMFVNFVDSHHADGRLAVWCKSMPDEQRRLVASGPERYFVPPYVGVKGWIGVRLDHPEADSIELAIIVERGWTEIAPPRLVRDPTAWAAAATKAHPPPPERRTTDPKRAAVALERVTALCLALPEATMEREGQHATFRTAKKKVFAYFLDDHHGDGAIGVCLKGPPGQSDVLVAKEPGRFYFPSYMGRNGWVGVKVDTAKVDWRDVGARITASHALITAPKKKAPPRAQARKAAPRRPARASRS